MTTTILLTRHGQTEWNREERFRGQIDVPLNATGERQAEALAARLVAFPVAAIYTAPLQRARRTAEICAARLGLTPQVLPGLLDANYGEWQGLSPSEIAARYPDQYRQWLSAPGEVTFPGGERFADMQARALAALQAVVARHPGETAVLVAHMAVNKALLSGILGVGLNAYWLLRQDTCALNILRCHGSGYEIVALNDTCHMDSVG